MKSFSLFILVTTVILSGCATQSSMIILLFTE